MEGSASSTIASFRYGIIGIGDSYPRPAKYSRQKFCPLCDARAINSPLHLTFFCPALEKFRKNHTALTSFRNICMAGDCSEDDLLKIFLNGLDWKRNPVAPSVFVSRGNDLSKILDYFLSKW